MTKVQKFLFIILYLLAFYLLIPSINNTVKPTDEGIYVKVTQEMQESDRPFTPTYFNSLYYNKLPLRIWISYLTNKLIGEHNFSYRIPEVIFTLILLLLVVTFTAKLTKKYSIGLTAGLLFITSHLYLNVAKQYTTNNLVLLFNVWVLYLLWIWYQKYKEGKAISYLMSSFVAVLTAAAFFTKTIMAGLPPFVFFIFLIFEKELLRFIKVNIKHIILIVVLFFIIVGVLLIPMMIQGDSDKMFRVLFLAELYKRATVGFHNVSNKFYYLKYVCSNQFAVPSVLLLMSCLYSLKTIICQKKIDSARKFIWIWFLAPIALFSCANSRLYWYILFSVPPVAILSACCTVGLFSDIKKEKNTLSKLCLTALALLAIFLVYFQLSKAVNSTGFTARKIVDVFTHNILEFKAAHPGQQAPRIAIEEGMFQTKRRSALKVAAYYLSLIRDDTSYLSNEELDEALSRDAYDFYLVTLDRFSEINGRYHPKGMAVQPPKSNFRPSFAVFSLRYGSDFSPLIDNVSYKLPIAANKDVYTLNIPRTGGDNILLTLFWDSKCGARDVKKICIAGACRAVSAMELKQNNVITFHQFKRQSDDITFTRPSECLSLRKAFAGIPDDKNLSNKLFWTLMAKSGRGAIIRLPR